jgi:formylglycine-generating enzyme required for sulfatase activity
MTFSNKSRFEEGVTCYFKKMKYRYLVFYLTCIFLSVSTSACYKVQNLSTDDSSGDSGSSTDSDADVDTDTDSDSDSDTDTDSDTDVDTDSDSDSDTDSDSDSDTDTDSDSDTDTDSDSDTDTDTDIDTGTDVCVDGATTVGNGGTTWVTVCGGTFQMGSNDGDLDETPVHTVTVPSFEMLETEVTVAQYGECVDASVCTVPQSGGMYDNWGVAGRENHPVNKVDWNQATTFCTWIGGRLPSESEWEYAASNGAGENTYPWGDETATCDYAVMDDDTHTAGCDTERTWPVCSKTAGNTSHGLCDMAGNISEWVQDWMHSDYTGAPSDGSAWDDSGSYRVRRSSSFRVSAVGQRASYRRSGTPSFKYNHLGFRCGRDAP